MTPLRAVVAGCLLALVGALVFVLSARQPQIASTDRVPNGSFVEELTKGERLCQVDEAVPAGATALRMTIGTYGKPGPPLRVDITQPAAASSTAPPAKVASGVLAAGWRQGVVELPISRVRRDRGGATVCVEDLGAVPVALAGNAGVPYAMADFLDGHLVYVGMRIDYMLPGRPSWFGMFGAIAHRLTLAKGSYYGDLGWIAPLALMLLVVGVVVRLLLAGERER